MIKKFTFDDDGELELPGSCHPMHVYGQRGKVCLWADDSECDARWIAETAAQEVRA